MLEAVGSNLTICKLEPTTPNTSKQVAEHVAPNNVPICCVAMLGSFDPGLTSDQCTSSDTRASDVVSSMSCYVPIITFL